MTLERGTLLHKRYRIVEILGQGGMGSVYRAVDENLGVDVALKENLFTTDEYARQFRLEAVILANLRHPNLPRVSDHFVLGDQGQYLVMDYIDGEDLRQRMERVGMIEEEEVILIGAAICDALEYLHTRKPPILHRDLKPGNVKVTPDGHIFLVDFGLAKVVQGTQATTTGARAMTPGYSPPEQYGTARTDARTDVYSLGATLYASLCGVIPEDGLARAMENAHLTPLRKRNSKISRRLANAIERAMAVDPADRFQSADEFKKALLGSKSKTQRLTGKYTVTPPPDDFDVTPPPEEDKHQEPVLEKKPGLMAVEPQHDFQPPKRKKKKRGSGCFLMFLILIALIGSAVGVSLLRPEIIPPNITGYIPWIQPTSTPTSLPTVTPTQTSSDLLLTEALPSQTETRPAPTKTRPAPTKTRPAPTKTPSAPTETLGPTSSPTITPTPAPPTITNTPAPTKQGGGYGQIAFASDRTGIPQIYTVNLDGGALQPITKLPEGACQPSWSPDGAQIVFTSPCAELTDTYPQSSLYMMNADGSDITQITFAPGGDYDPAWSPDGDRIAFTSMRDGQKEIYILILETTDLLRVTEIETDVENNEPAWSPFGDQIAFVKKRVGAYQIWAVTDTGQSPVQVSRSGQQLWDYSPLWSVDGIYVLFNQKPANTTLQPWVMEMSYEDRGTTTAVELQLGASYVENIQYSPDGLWILYESLDLRGNRDIYYMTSSGSAHTRLTTDPAIDFDPVWRPGSP
jgi:serine/threonine protein kinase/Tol biopolymer transport system component